MSVNFSNQHRKSQGSELRAGLEKTLRPKKNKKLKKIPKPGLTPKHPSRSFQSSLSLSKTATVARKETGRKMVGYGEGDFKRKKPKTPKNQRPVGLNPASPG